MRMRSFARLCLSVCAVCLALPGCNRVEIEPRPLPTGPSVLLVTIDTLRWDYVGAHRAGRDTETPTLDELAATGVGFANAVATAPLTLPSHTSIMTGIYPPHHGVRHNASFRAAPELETLAERFQAAGYATGAVVGAAVLGAQFGLAQGFDEYDGPAPGSAAAPGGFDERPAADVTERALAFLGRVDRPFFLWVHYYDPHKDYAPPARYRERFAKDPYAGEVAYVDAELGRLILALRERGQLKHTLVSVTADHGEGLGEHGELDHSYLVYESTQHVPWIVSGPGIPAGRSVDTVVSNAAVAPTLAGLAGVGVLAQAEVESAAWLWGDAAQPSDGWAYSESLAGELEFGWAPLYAIRRGPDKFIDAPRAELYDLASDPRERTNLLETSPAPSERAERAAKLAARVRSGERVAAPSAVDAETRAQVEALGYVVPLPGGNAGGAGEDPKDVHQHAAVAQRALAAFFAGDFALSEKLAHATLERMPNAVRAHELLARIYAQSGRPRGALSHARETVRLNPFYAGYHASLGSIQLQLGDVAAAVEAFEEAVRLEPNTAPYLAGLVWKAELGGSVLEADANARRAIELAPTDVALRAAIGETWESAGEYERALAIYRAAAERFPHDELIQMRLAIYYARLGEDARAAEHVARAGPRAHDRALATRLAITYAGRGAYERAEPILRELAAREPGGPAPALLARLLRETGREAEAQLLLQSAAPPPAAPAPN